MGLGWIFCAIGRLLVRYGGGGGGLAFRYGGLFGAFFHWRASYLLIFSFSPFCCLFVCHGRWSRFGYTRGRRAWLWGERFFGVAWNQLGTVVWGPVIFFPEILPALVLTSTWNLGMKLIAAGQYCFFPHRAS